MGRGRSEGRGEGRALALAGLALGISMVSGCGEEVGCPPLVVESETPCATTDDCVAEGFTTLRCVNRVCALPCVSNSDCGLEATQECRAEQGSPPPAVCVQRTCRLACPEDPCASGETCHLGRCVVAVEDFELRSGQSVGSFERYGWNGLSTELENPNNQIVDRGDPGCSIGDSDCAGPAASGESFALVGTQATSEKGTATLGPTCRPCACCLECVLAPYPDAPDVSSRCPLSPFVPAPLMCPAAVPPTCAAVCAACEGCGEAGPERVTANLVSCEATAAAKTCPSCPACDGAACRTCREGPCQTECVDVDDVACRECERASCPACGDCRDCEVCGEATNCELVDPNAANCRARRLECDALGADGCYPTPLRYDRSELLALEQALVSPEIDLASLSGPLVLSFAYVPFSVGRSYFESRQGVPASMWQRRPQELVVELCAGNCGTPEAWVSAEQVTGGAASFPPEARRDNGLSVGKQSEVDWRSGRVEVIVPEALRTANFRFRFLPRLAPEARIGIDDIRLERR